MEKNLLFKNKNYYSYIVRYNELRLIDIFRFFQIICLEVQLLSIGAIEIKSMIVLYIE